MTRGRSRITSGSPSPPRKVFIIAMSPQLSPISASSCCSPMPKLITPYDAQFSFEFEPGCCSRDEGKFGMERAHSEYTWQSEPEPSSPDMSPTRGQFDDLARTASTSSSTYSPHGEYDDEYLNNFLKLPYSRKSSTSPIPMILDACQQHNFCEPIQELEELGLAPRISFVGQPRSPPQDKSPVIPEIEQLPAIELFPITHARAVSDHEYVVKKPVFSFSSEPAEPFVTGLEGWEPVPGLLSPYGPRGKPGQPTRPLQPRKLQKAKSTSELKVSKILGKTESQREEMDTTSIPPVQFRSPRKPAATTAKTATTRITSFLKIPHLPGLVPTTPPKPVIMPIRPAPKLYDMI